ncbi:MAG: MATE family efflux transporter [Vibrio sp.]
MLQFRDENQHLLAQTIKIGIPVALQSALVAILSLADVLMVSSFGTEATAAVGLASKWHFVAIMIMAGLSSASGILIAQFWGRNDRSAAKSITLLAIKSGALLLLPVSILFVVFSKPIFLLQTSDVDVIRLGSDYLWYASPVLLLTHLVIVFESTLRSTNNALTPLLIAVMTIAVNIILNYGMISGHFGMPALGVAGAALATTLARALQLMVFCAYFHYRQHWLKTTLPLKASRITLKRKYIRLAIPAVANALLWAIGTLAYQMIFGHMGTLELAVYSTLGQFESLCYALFFGLSVACSVSIGQHLGRANYTEARSTSLIFIKMFALLGVISTTILLAIQPWLLKLLALDNAQFLPLSQPGLTILSVVISLKMLNMVIINGILRAGGENTFCLRTDFIAMWLLGLPISAIAAFILHWPFHYVYPLMIIEELVKLTLCWRRYRQYIWLRNLTDER